MREEDARIKDSEPVRPLRNFLFGLGFPVIFIGGGALIGILTALSNGSTEFEPLANAAELGAWLGLFVSVAGIAEIAFALASFNRRVVNGAFRAIGYVTVWLVAYGVYRIWS